MIVAVARSSTQAIDPVSAINNDDQVYHIDVASIVADAVDFILEDYPVLVVVDGKNGG
jgi:hypothetical protein